jgi:enoyl-[acyl-carrier-protein] reductase (NADH)
VEEYNPMGPVKATLESSVRLRRLAMSPFLVSARAATLTGNVEYIDAGCHLVG